jgi:hypothetical protein
MERPEEAVDRPPRRRFQHRLFGSPGGAGEPAAGDREAARAAGCEALAERLVRLLAERSDDPEGEPAAVLVAGSDPDAIAAALAAAGHRVSALAPPGRPVEAASSLDAAAPERLTGDLLIQVTRPRQQTVSTAPGMKNSRVSCVPIGRIRAVSRKSPPAARVTEKS